MKLERLLDIFSGYYILDVTCGETIFLNMLMNNYIRYRCIGRTKEHVRLYFTSAEYKKLCRLLPGNSECCNFTYAVVKEGGFPRLVRRYRRRPGIFCGALLFFLTLYVSTLFIWDIRIEGTEKLTEEEVTMQLEELGCKIGSFIPSLNFYSMCNDFIRFSDNISWISVNMRGNVAYVELIEREFPLKNEDIGMTPANVVASHEGIIEYFTVFEGIPVISPGELVKKGQLLISGVTDTSKGPLRLLHASGGVYAKTFHTLEVAVPYDTTRKVTTGEALTQKTIKIFGKSINLFLKGRNLPEKCDTIVESKRVVVGGQITMPMTLVIYSYIPYENVPYTRTDEEAMLTAEQEMSQKIQEELVHSEILSRATEAGQIEIDGKKYYRILCRFECLTNIAQTVAFH